MSTKKNKKPAKNFDLNPCDLMYLNLCSMIKMMIPQFYYVLIALQIYCIHATHSFFVI